MTKRPRRQIVKQEELSDVDDVDTDDDDGYEKALDAVGSLRRNSHIRPYPSIKCGNVDCTWVFKDKDMSKAWCRSVACVADDGSNNNDAAEVLRCPSCQQLTRVPTFTVVILTKNSRTTHVDTVRLYSERATIKELRFAYRNFRWTARTKVGTIMDQLAKYDHDIYWNVVHYGIKVKSINTS